MTGPEHYLEAERLCDAYKQATTDVDAMPADTAYQFDNKAFSATQARALLEKAQVHATLALAAATAADQANAYDGDELGARSRGWAGVA
jgi:hypothetical protein